MNLYELYEYTNIVNWVQCIRLNCIIHIVGFYRDYTRPVKFRISNTSTAYVSISSASHAVMAFATTFRAPMTVTTVILTM